MANDPILSLKTTKERRTISIDDQLFEMLDPGDLTMADQVQLQSIGEKVKAIDTAEVTEEHVRFLSETLNGTIRKAVRGIDSVMDKLTDTQKAEILKAFLETSASPAKTESADMSASASAVAGN